MATTEVDMRKINIAKFPTKTSNAVVWISLLAAMTLGFLGPNLGWWDRHGAAVPDRPGLSAHSTRSAPLGEQIAAADAIWTLRHSDTGVTEAWKRILVRHGTPKLEAWIRETRNRIRVSGAEPIPTDMRNRLAVYFKPHEFVGLRFVVDAALGEEMRRASFDFGNDDAVCLADVIVFRDRQAATSDVAWARGLALCRQFERWGIQRFAGRYLENWRQIAGEVERDTARYTRFLNPAIAPRIGVLEENR
jgi:hypothetical protein